MENKMDDESAEIEASYLRSLAECVALKAPDPIFLPITASSSVPIPKTDFHAIHPSDFMDTVYDMLQFSTPYQYIAQAAHEEASTGLEDGQILHSLRTRSRALTQKISLQRELLHNQYRIFTAKAGEIAIMHGIYTKLANQIKLQDHLLIETTETFARLTEYKGDFDIPPDRAPLATIDTRELSHSVPQCGTKDKPNSTFSVMLSKLLSHGEYMQYGHDNYMSALEILLDGDIHNQFSSMRKRNFPFASIAQHLLHLHTICTAGFASLRWLNPAFWTSVTHA